MNHPFEEREKAAQQALWAIRNFHIIVVGSAIIVLIFQLALAGILS